MSKKNQQSYEDIMNIVHPTSKKHPPMSKLDRAAQFAPFAALTGHKEAIKEIERLTEEKKLLDENKKNILDYKLRILMQKIKEYPEIVVTYFKSDVTKSGGRYETMAKRIKKIDEQKRMMIFVDQSQINIDDIYDIEIVVSCDSL